MSSNTGTAGVFNNSVGGPIISGRSKGVQVFGVNVDGDGQSVLTAGHITATGGPNGDGIVGNSESGAGVKGSSGLGGGPDAVGVVGIADTSHAVAGVFAEGGQVEALIAQNGLSAQPSGIPAATVEIRSSNDRDLGYGSLLIARTASGSCVIDLFGNLACTGHKSAVVPIRNNRRVALYAMESAENWFEDFGSAKLASGAATVKLDPVFAETVNSAVDYHVFLTPNGNCKGLYIAKKTPTTFEVRELGSGKSDVSFDYRIVARRKGYENVRLADMTE